MAVNPVYEEKARKSRRKIIITGALVIIAIALIAFVLIFRTEKVSYKGNSFYTNEELEKMILPNGTGGNTLITWLKFRWAGYPEIRFVEDINCRIEAPNELSFSIAEKVLVGCVDYMGTYMFFDNNGIIIESSSKNEYNVPIITGLTFDHVLMNEKLPVDNDRVFDTILILTRLLVKYNLYPDKLYFDVDGNGILTFNKARVFLGKNENMTDKISDLSVILPKIENESGELHMENYSKDKNSISFTRDNTEQNAQ